MNLKTLLVAIVFGWGASSVSAATQHADLLSVYQAAAVNDAQLSAARHAYQAQREAVPQARAGLLPSLTAGATSDLTRLERDEPSLSRERSGATFRANLSQPLFRLDRWYQLKAAKYGVQQAELELAAKEQNLILSVAQAYFETLRQLDSLAAAKAVHTVGGVVTPAQTLMVLVPDGQPVEVEAMLENKDVGFVRAGQAVTV